MVPEGFWEAMANNTWGCNEYSLMYPIRRNPDLGTNQTLLTRYGVRMICKIEFFYVPCCYYYG